MVVPHRKKRAGGDDGGDRDLEAVASLIEIPFPWDIDGYIAAVAHHRQRTIRVEPVNSKLISGLACGTGTGMWVERGDEDVVLYGAEVSERHRDHIILHELGHMLMDHRPSDRGVPVSDLKSFLVELMPTIEPETVRRVLGRTDYADDIEREAEQFAGIVMVRATLAPRHHSELRKTFFRTGYRS